MASTSTYVLATFIFLLAAIGGYVYLFGIPKEVKREMEEQALKTMGENKASFLMNDAIGKVPDSDQQDVKELKKGLSNASGGVLQNPAGKAAGDVADDATAPLTGR
ncbi:hypothetical protein KC340_g16808 [Hortaea werneckii]|nr:hypothetical protein KC342_g17140 [Hortaea werneckii]KAI7074744.1 hypothetical protein KC339_g14044 [Hortaea werneckii]KAI7225469.1 hypothetical protein KC365_g9961 [Hortaea werneckii]KAI7292299.1 hypothetical protein KC340_g16808 [Hortaea werneckii]KAI7366523.1 hypothetical protein KC328_g18469 [Hortaea werneckii]